MTAARFETFGCRLNAFETEAMRSMSERAGLEGAVVVNSCAVTAQATARTRREIRRQRRENPGARVIVTGCAAQIDPEAFAAMPEVDAVIGNAEKMSPDTWTRLAALGAVPDDGRVSVGDIMDAPARPAEAIDGFGARARAYVQVQNGCDHRCTFCVIPYGRGNSRSEPAERVSGQVCRLVERGYREVVLTGVDLTAWGADLPGAPRLGDLVARILRDAPDLERLRLSSIDSVEADDRLMEAIGSERRLMPHLHLSLQHGDDLVLKRMKRRHSRDDAIRFVREARRLRPDIAFGADLIAGFPTETEEQFENSLRLVEECELTWLHVFPYSPRPGTPASRMPQVDGATIRRRAARLRDVGARARARHLEARVGERHSILVEGRHSGRTEQFAEVRFATARRRGEIVAARITGHDGVRLLA